jgi:flagellar protein FliS
MMRTQRGAAQYRSVVSHGLVADASPTRLVQIVFEHVLSELATAQGCMERIKNNMPLDQVVAKGKSLGKAIRHINQLNDTLDMQQGGAVAENLRSLYLYMLTRLTQANAINDPKLIAEVGNLIRKVKSGWDQIVTDER